MFCELSVKKKIVVFLGGEWVCFCLVGLLLGFYNILVFDEFGNYFDVEMIEVLVKVLMEYKGMVIFIVYDCYFM